jgi:hypothetical protein
MIAENELLRNRARATLEREDRALTKSIEAAATLRAERDNLADAAHAAIKQAGEPAETREEVILSSPGEGFGGVIDPQPCAEEAPGYVRRWDDPGADTILDDSSVAGIVIEQGLGNGEGRHDAAS